MTIPSVVDCPYQMQPAIKPVRRPLPDHLPVPSANPSSELAEQLEQIASALDLITSAAILVREVDLQLHSEPMR
jgi:hypothetical protein